MAGERMTIDEAIEISRIEMVVREDDYDPLSLQYGYNLAMKWGNNSPGDMAVWDMIKKYGTHL